MSRRLRTILTTGMRNRISLVATLLLLLNCKGNGDIEDQDADMVTPAPTPEGTTSSTPSDTTIETGHLLPAPELWCKKETLDADTKNTIDVLISRYSLSGDCNAMFGKLGNLSDIDLADKKIINLEALVGLKYLKHLYLPNNNITDIGPLAQLPQLELLDLGNNKIETLDPLKDLTALKTLDLSNNKIADISPLTGLNKLVNLVLNDNAIAKLAPVGGLANLKFLDITGNVFTDLDSIKTLKNLTGLELDEKERAKFTICPKDSPNTLLNTFCSLPTK